MGDYSFGPSAKGWVALFVFAVVGVGASMTGISLAILYFVHHLRWVK